MTDLDELKAFVKATPDPSCAHMDWPGAVLDLIERLEKAEGERDGAKRFLKESSRIGTDHLHGLIEEYDSLEAKKNARISELEAALKPFANVAQEVLEQTDDHWDAYVTLNGMGNIGIFHRDVFRNAAHVLGGDEQ